MGSSEDTWRGRVKWFLTASPSSSRHLQQRTGEKTLQHSKIVLGYPPCYVQCVELSLMVQCFHLSMPMLLLFQYQKIQFFSPFFIYNDFKKVYIFPIFGLTLLLYDSETNEHMCVNQLLISSIYVLSFSFEKTTFLLNRKM